MAGPLVRAVMSVSDAHASGRLDAGGLGASEDAGGAVPRAWPPSLLLPLTTVTAAVVATSVLGSDYQLTVLARVGVFALAVLGLNVLMGYGGQVSFGHNAFFGLGAYLSAVGTVQWGLPPVVALVIGIATSTLASVLVGLPTLRLRGHYLAVATFALGAGFYAFVGNSTAFNGFVGIAGIPALGVGGWTADSLAAKYVLVWAVVLVAAVLTWRLRYFRFGRALRSVSEDPDTAQSMGVDLLRYKVTAFAISAVYASVAGSLLAHTTSYVSPESFGWQVSITFFVMLFIGGMRSIWGSMIGALVIIGLPEIIDGAQELRPTIFSVMLIAILVARPKGLLASWSPAQRDRWRSRLSPSRAASIRADVR